MALKGLIYKRLVHGRIGRFIAHVVAVNPVIWGPPERLMIGDGAQVNDAHLNVSSGRITIGDHALIAHGAMVLTGTHDPRLYGRERVHDHPREGRDIVIGDGAWIASGAIVVGPVTIGKNAVVGAGAVVLRDVEDYEIVAGIPAKTVGWAK